MSLYSTEFDGLIKSMTPSVFAWLPPAWPENLTYFGGSATLLARVHENSFRRLPDGTIESDVIARALVYMGEEKMPVDFCELSGPMKIKPAHLARLTIRYVNTEFNYDYLKAFPEMQEFATWRIERARFCVEAIKRLPVIDFWELCRTWPPPLPEPDASGQDGSR